MSAIQTIRIFFTLPAFAVILAAALFTSFLTPIASAESTTWQKFIQEKCGGKSADAAERCSANLEDKLKEKCGREKDTDEYITCWRKFIRNNGGKAPGSSTPFETEESAPTGTGTGSTCGGVETSIIKCDADNSGGTRSNGLWQLLLIVVNILTAGIGIVAVGGIVYAAVLYTTAGDKADQVKQAVDIIVNVVIGLILFALMWSLLNFIVPGGVFN